MDKKILVVKYGSSSLSGENGLDINKIANYALKIKDLSSKYKIVIVSSGAVVAGKAIIGDNNDSTNSTIQAMVGSAALVIEWQKAFSAHGINVGQILVTHNDISDEIEGNRLRRVIHDAISIGVIPVINENDILSDIELAKLKYGGDNDGLASKIAITIGASDLLMLTNVDGLMDKNNYVVSKVDLSDLESALGLTSGKSDIGRGGMASKIEAAFQAGKTGVLSHIGNASHDYEAILAKDLGTHIN